MKDNFSTQADVYARYRPDYPPALYEFVLKNVQERNTAWDCGTGNGQTAKVLAKHFAQVYATDISEQQISKAVKATNITYSIQPAEKTQFADNSFDLITVSQALHWFKLDLFYKEVYRLGRPGSWIAVWVYNLPRISPIIDEIIGIQFYKEKIGRYWDPERKFVDEQYATIPFPFPEIQCPILSMDFYWTIEELLGYISSWSAVQKFIQAEGQDPLEELKIKLSAHWTHTVTPVSFPIYLRMGQVQK